MNFRVLLDKDYWRDFWRDLSNHALHSLIKIGGVILAYLTLRFLLYRLIDGVLAQLIAHEVHIDGGEARTGRLRTLQGLCKSVVGYVLFFVFGVQFIDALGFSIMPFITTAGVIGLAIGFGAQKLVKDVISGFFIIIDNLFVVGDTITIGTITGQVQEMGMRVTRLADASGKVYLFANGDIGTITNLSRHPVADFIDISVAATADLNQVVKTINTVGETLFAAEDHQLKSMPCVEGITAFNATFVTVRVAIAAAPRALPVEQMRVRGAVRDALLAANVALPP